RYYGINESSVRYIKKDEKKIRETAVLTFNTTAKRMVTSRNKIIVRMESALAVWISSCRKKHISLNTNTIRLKAKEMYEVFAAASDTDSGKPGVGGEIYNPQPATSSDSATLKHTFCASKGWFDKFQKRYGLKNISVHGAAAASTDIAAAEEYVIHELQRIIDEDLQKMKMKKSAIEDEEEEQVLNEEVKETGLNFERLTTLCDMAKDIKKLSKEWDEDMVRSEHFCDMIDQAFIAYRDILAQKKKQRQQLPITMFFPREKRTTRPKPSIEAIEGTAPAGKAPD
ncbi:tigger transposable element-derived protein 1-like, partial [Argonauta hians]